MTAQQEVWRKAREAIHKELAKEKPSPDVLDFWIREILKRMMMDSWEKEIGRPLKNKKNYIDPLLKNVVGPDYEKAREIIQKAKREKFARQEKLSELRRKHRRI